MALRRWLIPGVALLAVLLAGSRAGAQVVVVDAACPPCPPGAVCPPCVAPEVAVEGEATLELSVEPIATPAVRAATPTTRGVVGPATGVVTVHDPSADEAAAAPTPPTDPAPGTFALAYLGGWDQGSVWTGGGLRFTGHLDEIYFVEMTLGAMARPFDDAGRSLIEAPFLVGFRIMAPVVSPIVRFYGSIATGIAVHGRSGQPDVGAWSAWMSELGGGMEIGGPLEDHFSIGAFIDVRAAARVPFEREDPSIGVNWSGGLAFLWF